MAPARHAHADARERHPLAVPPLEAVELDRRFHGGEAYAGAVPRLVGINHVVLEVADLEEALAFYGRLFELELRGRVPRHGVPRHGRPVPRARRGPQPDGPDGERHFGLVVDDREEVRRRLEAAGAELLRGRGLDFRDPWGNHVQVVEYGDVQFTKSPPCSPGWAWAGS